MKLVKFAVPLVALAACGPSVSNQTRTVGGTTEVQVVSGDNCFDGQCWNYNPRTGQVQTVGRQPINPPAGITVNDEYVTAAEFAAIYSQT